MTERERRDHIARASWVEARRLLDVATTAAATLDDVIDAGNILAELVVCIGALIGRFPDDRELVTLIEFIVGAQTQADARACEIGRIERFATGASIH